MYIDSLGLELEFLCIAGECIRYLYTRYIQYLICNWTIVIMNSNFQNVNFYLHHLSVKIPFYHFTWYSV